jgi:hypothetical protein
MSSYNITLNSKNAVSNQPNVFQYNFPSGSFTVPEGATISVNQITLPYSWRNVSSALGNNTFSYTIPNSSNVQTSYTVDLSDGFYQVSDLNNALQAKMKTNGHYWYSTQGSYSQQIQFTGVISGTSPNQLLTIDTGASGFPQVQLYTGYVISYIPVGSTAYTTAIITGYSASKSVYTLSAGVTNTTSVAMTAQTNSEVIPTIIYPITISQTPSLYANTITSYTIPTSANVISVFGANFVQSNGQNGQPNWTGGYPTSGNQYATLTFPTTSSSTQTVGNILGFTSAGLNTTFYPAQTTTSALQTVSNSNSLTAIPSFPPKGSIVNGVIVRCNLVDNWISTTTDVLDSFPITSTYGSNINYLPISNNNIKMKSGKYSNLQITFNDDNFNTLYLLDQTVLISLIIIFP